MKALLKTFQGEIIFIILFATMSAFYYDGMLDKSPLNTHLWRQTDCLSITRNYSEGASFLSPEMDVLLADNLQSGKTAGEFPIMYWLVGKYWQLFGESHFVYRLFYLIILFTGLFALFKSLKFILKSNFWSIWLALLLFTSPVLIFYGVSFLTDAPAFCFILIALYFFIRYFRDYKNRHLVLAFSLISLAGLIKISSLIGFVFIGFIFLLELFGISTLKGKKLFKRNIFEWVGFAMVLIVIFSWYLYADYYNSLHGFKYTFNSIFPFWLTDQYDLNNLLTDIKNHASIVFLSRPLIIFLIISFLFLLIQSKKIPRIASLANIIVCLGALIYFLLWFPLLGIHDYYYVALLIIIPAILIPAVWLIKERYQHLYTNRWFRIFLTLFLIFNFVYAADIISMKKGRSEAFSPLKINTEFVSLMNWTNWNVYSDLKRFERIGPFLKTHNIKNDDRVISLPDQSFNITLYLMNRRGWTNFKQYNKSKEIQELIDIGKAKYLFISDSTYLSKDFMQPFLTNSVGNFEGIEVYRLD